jgi:2-polyprenyl-3-methyl-5-hydroxy-6-metoxy-1,4-benzoquinol methylase
MKKTFNCQICKSNSWKSFETYLYLRDDLEKTKYTKYSSLLRKICLAGRVMLFAKPRNNVIHYDVLSPYHKLRREVLFNVWFKQNNEVKLDAICCDVCGFVCYTPRPDEVDIVNKYQYLNKYQPSVNRRITKDQYTKSLDSKRAARIFKKCSEYISDKQVDVLDYGGGNGVLMSPFLKNGFRCYLIDYNEDTLPGITKIGNDINNCQANIKFDVIICSHVLEHVSEISGLVNKLKDFLSSDGIIYAEVPQEILAGLRIDADPVTHINYFTKNSFANLFLANGFEILEKQQQISSYANTYMEVIWVVVKPGVSNTISLLSVDTGDMLFPSRLYSLIKFFRLLIEPKLRKLLKIN